MSELTYAQIFEAVHDEDGGGYLHTFNKSSASIAEGTEWQVVNNVPQGIERFTTDLDHFTKDGLQGTLEVTEEWRDGEWHTVQNEFTPHEDEDAP